MASSVNPMQDQITCSVCLEIYRDPHVLTECLHSFCLDCIQKLDRDGGIQCPQCRAHTPTNRVKKDFNMQGIIDAYQQMNQGIAGSFNQHQDTGNEQFSSLNSIHQQKSKLVSYLEDLEKSHHEMQTKLASVDEKLKKAEYIKTKQIGDIDRCTAQAIQDLLANQNHLNDTVNEAHAESQKEFSHCKESYIRAQGDLKDKVGMLSGVLERNDEDEMSRTCNSLNLSAVRRTSSLRNQVPRVPEYKEPSIVVVKGTGFDPKTVVNVTTMASTDTSNSVAPTSVPQVHHVGVKCDGCTGRIYGVRFKCCVCPDFDLCQQCEDRRYHRTHAMIRLRCSKRFWSLTSSQKDRVRFVQDTLAMVSREDLEMAENAVHLCIGCDGCDELPIRGVRYKCCVCPDYDICQRCEAMGVHEDHEMIKIRVPKTSYF